MIKKQLQFGATVSTSPATTRFQKRPINPILERRLLDNVGDLPFPTESEQLSLVRSFIGRSHQSLGLYKAKTSSAFGNGIILGDGSTIETAVVLSVAMALHSKEFGFVNHTVDLILRTASKLNFIKAMKKQTIRTRAIELLTDPRITSIRANDLLLEFLDSMW